MGSIRHHFPIRTAQWRAFIHGLRVHSRRLWSDRSGLLHGRNGFDVHKTISVCYRIITNVVQRPDRWRAVSMVC